MGTLCGCRARIIGFIAVTGLLACAGPEPSEETSAYEVWLVDQSNTRGKDHGGTLYIFAGQDLEADASATTPRETIDLSMAVTAMCMAQTGANPVRPHMLLFNEARTHGVLSFVASGHVVILDAAMRAPVSCLRTTQSPTGRQAHAAYPAPDGTFILVANQNGKRLERITADYASGTFTHDGAATLDLATCTTPAGQPCQAPGLRPDNAPICPVLDRTGSLAFVTLRGGGLFVVDPRATPMAIVGEYDVATVKGNGCGGVQVGDDLYLNSGGRPGPMEHLAMYGFEVYRFPTTGYAAGTANTPAPVRVFAADGEHDSHGMVEVAGGHVWVMDRHANVAEVIETSGSRHVNTVALDGPLSADPAPDLVDVSPGRNRLFVALRGTTPLSGDPHIATGSTPGLGVIAVDADGRGGRLEAVIRIHNAGDDGVDRADAHAVRVRRR